MLGREHVGVYCAALARVEGGVKRPSARRRKEKSPARSSD